MDLMVHIAHNANHDTTHQADIRMWHATDCRDICASSLPHPLSAHVLVPGFYGVLGPSRRQGIPTRERPLDPYEQALRPCRGSALQLGFKEYSVNSPMFESHISKASL